MKHPTAIEIDGRRYEINTGYEYALACFSCIDDTALTGEERAFGVLGLLYRTQPRDTQRALALAIKYLQLGKERRPKHTDDEGRDLDFRKDMHYIRSSFRSDYGINLAEQPGMHWWEFSELLQGLTDTSVLNRVRDIRNYDLTKIKDPQLRAKMQRAQEDVALEDERSEEDDRRLDDFYAQLK